MPSGGFTRDPARWTDFPEVILPAGIENLGELYWKSECRPLRLLRPIFTKIQKAHKGLTFRAWLDLRDRARKDIYWLGHDCIGTEMSGAGFVEHVHREMLSMFVQKNFDGVYHKNYGLDTVRKAIGRQKREKEMLLLTPRGSMKSTCNKIDAAQWMLNAPDIRILIITGAADLSDKFLKETKGFFYKPEKTAYTFFQSLFPEYVIEGEDGISAADMICPARICRQEGQPSLWVNSIGGAVAGWHCDLMKGDDVVNEKNSNTEETREKLKDRYDNASQNLPDAHAFRDQLGTRYVADDWYGGRIEDAKKYAESNSLKYLCRSTWTVLPGFETVPIKRLESHMVEMYFPEKLPFATEMRKCRANEKLFRCQQLNEPAGSDLACDFDEAAIQAHTIIINRVPRPDDGPRRVIIVWDTAHDNKVTSDYSAGAVGYCHEPTRALYVLEVSAGKWKDSETAIQLVDLHWKWNAVFTEIERFAGWELFAAEVQRVSMGRHRKYLPLVWRTPDMSSGAKRNRVKGLETLLNNDRLWFVDGDWMDTLTQQFIRFTGFSKKRKDDIPDAIAGLQRLIPAERQEQVNLKETDSERKAREAQECRDLFAQQHSEAGYRTIFSTPPVAPSPEPELAVQSDPGPGRILPRGLHL